MEGQYRANSEGYVFVLNWLRFILGLRHQSLMNAFESNLQFIERHHQNVLQTVPILLKGTLFIFFDWGAPNNHDGRNRMGVNALFEVMRQAVNLSLHMAALADDLGD